jgi:hypothetical protein
MTADQQMDIGTSSDLSLESLWDHHGVTGNEVLGLTGDNHRQLAAEDGPDLLRIEHV